MTSLAATVHSTTKQEAGGSISNYLIDYKKYAQAPQD